jgi:hypothetical protein
MLPPLGRYTTFWLLDIVSAAAVVGKAAQTTILLSTQVSPGFGLPTYHKSSSHDTGVVRAHPANNKSQGDLRQSCWARLDMHVLLSLRRHNCMFLVSY